MQGGARVTATQRWDPRESTVISGSNSGFVFIAERKQRARLNDPPGGAEKTLLALDSSQAYQPQCLQTRW